MTTLRTVIPSNRPRRNFICSNATQRFVVVPIRNVGPSNVTFAAARWTADVALRWPAASWCR